MVKVSAPGKIMLSGEWSILENGVPCIVLSLDKRVYAKAQEGKEMSVNLKDFGIKTKARFVGQEVVFEKPDEKLSFTKNAIETALAYLYGKGAKAKAFSLETESEISAIKINGTQMKPGFGSSAAAVVAIIGAILKLHGLGIESEKGKETLFKLGIIAHYKAQGKIGSGFDAAASTFGGALVYKRFDAKWLAGEMKSKKIHQIAQEKWPLLEHRRIELPENMGMLIGFTGKSSLTKELVQKMEKFKTTQKGEYEKIIFWIKETTEALIEAIEKKEEKEILTLIDENKELLRELGEQSGAEIETPEHRKMAEIATKYYASAKVSGAGGGDCGICIYFRNAKPERIAKEWKESGIILIDAKISEEGVRVEK